MIVWLDLEETCINNWFDGLLVNTSRLKHWLDARNVTELRIWSYAIYDQKDKDYFVSSGMKQMLETALGRPILEWPSVDEMRKEVEKYEGIIYESRTEFMQLHGKAWSFIKYCLSTQRVEECFLIDDAVPNFKVTELDLLLNIHIIKVQSI